MSFDQTLSDPKGAKQEYSISTRAPGDLSKEELAVCVQIIREGGAVAIKLEKLQNARMLAIARKGGVIVAVGSIKRDRPDRAAGIAQDSGVDFPKETPELGYVAVAPQHRRQGLSHQVVGALLKAMPGGLFATTDDQPLLSG